MLKFIEECQQCSYNKKYDGQIVICTQNNRNAVVIPRPTPFGMGKKGDTCVECPSPRQPIQWYQETLGESEEVCSD